MTKPLKILALLIVLVLTAQATVLTVEKFREYRVLKLQERVDDLKKMMQKYCGELTRDLQGCEMLEADKKETLFLLDFYNK